MDLLGAGSPTNASAAGSNSNDLLSLSGPNPFAASMVQASTAPTVSAPPPGSTDLFGPPAPAQGAGSPWGATSVPRAGKPFPGHLQGVPVQLFTVEVAGKSL